MWDFRQVVLALFVSIIVASCTLSKQAQDSVGDLAEDLVEDVLEDWFSEEEKLCSLKPPATCTTKQIK